MAAERLSAAAVGEIVKRYATAVGLDPGNQRSNSRDAGNRQTFLRAVPARHLLPIFAGWVASARTSNGFMTRWLSRPELEYYSNIRWSAARGGAIEVARRVLDQALGI